MTNQTIIKNEWAKDNLPEWEQMVCEDCGKIVSNKWMNTEFIKEVGQHCGPCFFKTGKGDNKG